MIGSTPAKGAAACAASFLPGNQGERMKSQHRVGMGLIVLGAGIAANAVLGPLALCVIRFHNSASAV